MSDLHFQRRLLGKGQLFKTQKNALLMVNFEAEHSHLGERWSSWSQSLCLSVKTSPSSGHMLSPLTDSFCMREEHLGHFSLEH